MNENTKVQPCGDGWCVKTPVGLEGPLDSVDDASHYAALLNRVNAARTEMVCQETDCQ